jgi:hypothetical protein
MKTLSELLRDADPVDYEPRRSAHERRIARQTVLTFPHLADGPLPRRPIAMVALVAVMLVGIALGSHYWSPAATDVTAAVATVRFEVRLAEENPAAGLREATIAGTTRTIYLHGESVVTNGDIAEAQVIEGDGTSPFSVSVSFTSEGAAKMLRATQDHIGRPVAILINGDVVMAPVVRSAITTSANINGDFTKSEVERIVAGIIGR